MISVVMPYWRRPEALRQSWEAYRRLYAGEELEVIVVDDGSPEPAPDLDGIEVLRLLGKSMALNPCVPFNTGVRRSRGDVIVLTNPEVVHRTAILPAMREELHKLGPKGYVAAACWSAQQRIWFCHSILSPSPKAIGRAPMPQGAGLHFCAMLHRTFYEEIGGFSEEYRDGQGYEDNDLLWKLHAAGAAFKIRDDLVTDHIDCPRTEWPLGGLERNRRIFEERWG